MTTVTEVVISSDSSGQMWNTCVWDPSTGTSLMTYKGGGVSAPRCLSLVGNDYLFSAEASKPLLHAWALNSQEEAHLANGKMVCSGCVNALSVSPDGNYCIAGIAEKLHVWQIPSGRHLAVASQHFQDITCLKFTDDGSHIASGSEDCRVIVWSLPYIISQYANDMYSVPGDAAPRYTFFDHSLPVKDITIGSGGMRALLISVSLDQTGKIYDLSSGKMLLSIVYDVPLVSVTIDHSDTQVFIGSSDGNIFEYCLCNPPREVQHVVDKQKKKFIGHNKAITSLSCSLDGQTLLSGSNDSKVIIWDLISGQCKRILQHKGPVTNAFFAVAPLHLFAEDWKPSILLNGFRKISCNNTDTIEIMTKFNLDALNTDNNIISNIQRNIIGSENNEVLETMRKINADLYKFALDKLLPEADCEDSDLVEEPRVIKHKIKNKKNSKNKKKNLKNRELEIVNSH